MKKIILVCINILILNYCYGSLVLENMTNFPKVDPINYDEITCMVKNGSTIFVGTRYFGVQKFNGTSWSGFNSGLPLWSVTTPNNYKTIKNIVINGSYLYVNIQGATTSTSGIFRTLLTSNAWSANNNLLPKDITNTFYDITCMTSSSIGVLVGSSTGKVRFCASGTNNWVVIDPYLEGSLVPMGTISQPINSITLFSDGTKWNLAIASRNGVFKRATDIFLISSGSAGTWGSYTLTQIFSYPCYELVAIGGALSTTDQYRLLGIGGDIVVGGSSSYVKVIIRYNVFTNMWDMDAYTLGSPSETKTILLSSNSGNNVVISNNAVSGTTPTYIKPTLNIQNSIFSWTTAFSTSSEKPTFIYAEPGSNNVYAGFPTRGLYKSSFASFRDAKTHGTDLSHYSVDLAAINEAILLYPNPASSKITLQLPNEDLLTNIDIYNTTGQKVYVALTTNGSMSTLNVENLTDGLYLINATTTSGAIIRKTFVKE